MPQVRVKPLSVNECWQGRRFKTPEYKDYEEELLWCLPNLEVPKNVPLELIIEVGLSNKSADVDNVLKPFLDILQKKYGFNDKSIYKLSIEKFDVKKGAEFIKFSFSEKV